MKYSKMCLWNLLKDFEVESEEELLNKLVEESQSINCSRCGVAINIQEDTYKFIDGDPICERCSE